MRKGECWLAPPPDWKPIGTTGSNLASFIDMNNQVLGEVLTHDQILERFS